MTPVQARSVVTPILQEVGYLSQNRFRWKGDIHELEPHRFFQVKPSRGYPRIVAQVAQRLYDEFYSNPIGLDGSPPPGSEDEESHGRPFQDTLLEEEFQRMLATVRPNSAARRTTAIPSREQARVQVGRRDVQVQTGWYFVAGRRPYDSTSTPTVRLYWNVGVAGAALLVREVERRLNAAGVTFGFKILARPQLFQRADSAVLYLPQTEWARAARILPSIHRRVAPYLRRPAPLFTKILTVGLALAEDPQTDESFGTHRSRLLAEGTWDAFQTGATDVAGQWTAVRARFRKEGLSLARPYLNPGATDLYFLPRVSPGEFASGRGSR